MDIGRKIAYFYVKNKLSVQQISDLLKATPTKIRYSLDKLNIKRRSKADAIRYLNITKFNKGPFKIKNKLTPNEEKLKVAGVMIYWGEGTKGGGTVVLSNSDSRIIKLFLKFLRKICRISEGRLRIVIHRYPDHNEKRLLEYWKNVTGIPDNQFCKSFLHNKPKGSYKRISEQGTISLRYSDKTLLTIINKWISEYSDKL